jgi:hypothetical protein
MLKIDRLKELETEGGETKRREREREKERETVSLVMGHT